ncbi:cytochrome P450 [Gymnopus androsaceus JB14]|uniref:Cytochrome P450 n=1 Tax=Gymnopus androsaceus JB14 TaxID=1447944 RepID=A0A6A4GXN9_9AGAR|nr:cytochrome P450 [Gymnopus androsaceus JB14]
MISADFGSPQTTLFLLLGLAWAAVSVPRFIRWRTRTAMLKAIPTLGPSGLLSGYIGMYRFFTNARELLQEGYDKYPSGVYKIALLDNWVVIANGRTMIEDIKKASDTQLDMREAGADVLQVEYTLNKQLILDPYHVAIVRTPMTRNIATRFAEVRDETVAAFADLIPAQEDWVKIPAYTTSFQIVGRTANRFFVGLPLCRDPDWLDLNMHFAVNVFLSAQIINLFPGFLKPIAGRFLTRMPASWRKEEEYQTKDWPGKPVNIGSKDEQRDVPDLISRVLGIEVAAIHTTSTTFCGTLYELAAHPEVVEPLREEIESVVKVSGWTKEGISKMRKLDSFLKEALRFSGTNGLVNSRKVLQDFTFSNGTTVPAGVTIGVSAYMHHHDEALYKNADTFDAFRFYNMRSREGESIKHQAVSPDFDYITFGTGRNAWQVFNLRTPLLGRFFAVYEIKGLIAHILMSYDVKLEEEGVIPPYEWHGANMDPSSTGVILFRKRQEC